MPIIVLLSSFLCVGWLLLAAVALQQIHGVDRDGVAVHGGVEGVHYSLAFAAPPKPKPFLGLLAPAATGSGELVADPKPFLGA